MSQAKRWKKVILRQAERIRFDVDADGTVTPIAFDFEGVTHRVVSSKVDDRVSVVHCDVELGSGEAVHLKIEKGTWLGEIHTVETPWPGRWKGRLEG